MTLSEFRGQSDSDSTQLVCRHGAIVPRYRSAVNLGGGPAHGRWDRWRICGGRFGQHVVGHPRRGAGAGNLVGRGLSKTGIGDPAKAGRWEGRCCANTACGARCSFRRKKIAELSDWLRGRGQGASSREGADMAMTGRESGPVHARTAASSPGKWVQAPPAHILKAHITIVLRKMATACCGSATQPRFPKPNSACEWPTICAWLAALVLSGRHSCLHGGIETAANTYLANNAHILVERWVGLG
jgi:hypothetical protein